MPNKNYNSGRRKEYALIHKLRALGCRVAFRSAGSHSPIDVIGIDEENHRIFLYQSKPENIADLAVERLNEENKNLNGSFNVTFEVV
jgi:Holliday junction resolvase